MQPKKALIARLKTIKNDKFDRLELPPRRSSSSLSVSFNSSRHKRSSSSLSSSEKTLLDPLQYNLALDSFYERDLDIDQLQLHDELPFDVLQSMQYEDFDQPINYGEMAPRHQHCDGLTSVMTGSDFMDDDENMSHAEIYTEMDQYSDATSMMGYNDFARAQYQHFSGMNRIPVQAINTEAPKISVVNLDSSD